MPDDPKPQPQDQPVRCRECDKVFKGFVYKIVPTTLEITVLVDADGDTVYDLVKVCGKCKAVFHWHTSDKTIKQNTEAFERLMRHYRPQSAIIADETKSTG